MSFDGSSATGSEWDGHRFANGDYHCGVRAVIKITESDRNNNKNRLYYACAKNKCRWIGWCDPIVDCNMGESIAARARSPPGEEVDLVAMREEMTAMWVEHTVLQDDNKLISTRTVLIEQNLLQLRSMILVCFVALFVMFALMLVFFVKM